MAPGPENKALEWRGVVVMRLRTGYRPVLDSRGVDSRRESIIAPLESHCGAFLGRVAVEVPRSGHIALDPLERVRRVAQKELAPSLAHAREASGPAAGAGDGGQRGHHHDLRLWPEP